jgi:hypothetical protein
VLRRICEPQSDEIIGDWRKLDNGNLLNLFSFPNIVGIIKSRRIRWVGHVVCIGEKRPACRLLVGKPSSLLNVNIVYFLFLFVHAW